MEDIEKMLLELKNTSELMVDLAYSSLIYDNMDIAEEVFFMEEMVDELTQNIQEMVVERVVNDNDASRALVLISLSNSLEEISDAAMQIADVVLRDVKPHPVIRLSMRDSEVIISTIRVDEGSELAGRTLGEVRLASQCGMWVIAIKRDKQYLYGPDKNTRIEPDDYLIARGPEDGEDEFRALASSELPVEPSGK